MALGVQKALVLSGSDTRAQDGSWTGTLSRPELDASWLCSKHQRGFASLRISRYWKLFFCFVLKFIFW